MKRTPPRNCSRRMKQEHHLTVSMINETVRFDYCSVSARIVSGSRGALGWVVADLGKRRRRRLLSDTTYDTWYSNVFFLSRTYSYVTNERSRTDALL